jgi:hypothetical protein
MKKLMLVFTVMSAAPAMANPNVSAPKEALESWKVRKAIEEVTKNPPKKPVRLVVEHNGKTYTISVNP